MKSNRLSLGLGSAALSCLAALLIFSGHLQGSASDSSWGFSVGNLDTTCKPCDNFYQFAMGGWMKENPIPAEYPIWGTFTQLRDNNLTAMRTILEAAATSNAAPGSNQQRIGDFYTSCMDTGAIEAAGLKPIATELAAINAINDRKSLEAAIVLLQREGASVLFRFSSAQDIKDSTRVIATAGQGGLGMPDRDYYFRDDEKSKQLRADYERHVAKILELAGDAPDQAVANAKTAVTIETALAKASRTRVELRDPEKNYNLMPLTEMKTLTPDWSWENYLHAVGAPPVEQVNVRQPEFFKEMNQELASVSLPDWKIYLRWHVIHDSAPGLSERFVQENFDFYDRKLSGTKQILPRWKRCVQSTDLNLGEALGQVYVDKYFPPGAKAHAEEMVNNLIAALRDDIPTLSWMGPETKKEALAKADKDKAAAETKKADDEIAKIKDDTERGIGEESAEPFGIDARAFGGEHRRQITFLIALVHGQRLQHGFLADVNLVAADAIIFCDDPPAVLYVLAAISRLVHIFGRQSGISAAEQHGDERLDFILRLQVGLGHAQGVHRIRVIFSRVVQRWIFQFVLEETFGIEPGDLFAIARVRFQDVGAVGIKDRLLAALGVFGPEREIEAFDGFAAFVGEFRAYPAFVFETADFVASGAAVMTD